LPDARTVRHWLEQSFRHVDVRPIGHLALWQAAEALAVADERISDEPSAADIAAATLYPTLDAVSDGEPTYRMVMVASHAPPLWLAPRRSGAPASGFAALAMHQAVEAGAQRRALEALVQAITVEREREREEFRTTIASLATELREIDARAEFLSGEVRSRDQTIANQQVLTARLAFVQEVADAHWQFLESRAGRALAVYSRLKNLLLG